MNFWITQVALFSLCIGSAHSFAPAASSRQLLSRESRLFQSSIALPEDQYIGDNGKIAQAPLRELDLNTNNAYTPSKTSVSVRDEQLVDVEEQLTILRSKSLKELKLACSRRNIQYGKFSDTEEYVQAIWQDMEKAFAYSVTGLVQPGAMVELTGEQLDLEMTRKDTLILVDVFATWCGPCRVIVPQLEVAARKLVEDEVRVVKIDSDKNPAWVGRYQVEGLPAILLIKEGNVIDRLEGAYSTSEIVSFVKQHTL